MSRLRSAILNSKATSTKKFGTATVTTESVGQFNDEEPIYDSDGNIIENSIYPEVRAAVPIKDDPTIQINHWRTWFLTTVFVIIFAGVNQFFSLRYPSMTIGFIVAQLVSYPVGTSFALLPNYQPLRQKC